MSRFFQDPSVKECLPIVIKYNDPTVAYSRFNPIRLKLFSSNTFFQNLDVTAFLQDNSILPCYCEGYNNIDIEHKHIVNGDLRIKR